MKIIFTLSLLSLFSLSSFGQFVFSDLQPTTPNNPTGSSNQLIDIDSDGDLDFINLSFVQQRNGWFPNDGSGNFGPKQNFISNLMMVYSIVEDLNNDNLDDIIYFDTYNYKIGWIQNNGNGNYSNKPSLYDEAISQSSIKTGDIDGDNDCDIIIAKEYGAISKFINDGNGNFSEIEISPSDDGEVELLLLDFDLDGDLDLIENRFHDGIFYYSNTGSGDFGTPQLIFDPNTSSTTELSFIHGADMNNDGYPDLSYYRSDSKLCISFSNQGIFDFNSPTILGNNPNNSLSNLETADFDSDGDLDIISGAKTLYPNNSFLLTIYNNLGNGQFSSGQIIDQEVLNYNLGDIDGDNDIDIQIGSDSSFGWYENLEHSSLVSGKIYWDFNSNGMYDTGDHPFENTIDINNGEISYFNWTDGNYELYLEDGSYTITSPNPQNWVLNSSPSSYDVSLAGAEEIPDLDFGFIPTSNIADINTSIANFNTICDEWVPFYFSWTNTGTSILDGEALVNMSDSIQDVNFYQDIPDQIIDASNFVWTFENLLPGEQINKTILLHIPSILDGFEPGDSLLISINVNYESTNLATAITGISTFEVTPAVLCSYDPNDKLVYPDREGADNLILVAEELIYTIRFQNTGNYLATDIVLKDTLDPNLDASTFRVLNSSHSDVLTTTKDNNDIITFNFENILLPDSLSDPIGSQGFVSYSIMPKSNLSVGAIIENQAAIYFDSNPPIYTNTTTNTITDHLPTSIKELNTRIDFNVFPNPASDQVEISLAEHTNKHQVVIYDVHGKEIFSSFIQDRLTVNTKMWVSGLYMILIYDDLGKIMGYNQLIKTH